MTMGRGGMFGYPGGGAAPGRSPILARMLADPRYGFAQTVTKGASDTSPTNEIGGLARILQGAVGGYMTGKLHREGKDAEEARRTALAQALTAMQGGQDDYGSVIPPDRARAAQILMGNQDTADMGFGLTMADMQRQQEMADRKDMARFGSDLAVTQAERMIPVNAQGAAATQAATMPGQIALMEAGKRLELANAAFLQDRSHANAVALQQAGQEFTAAQAKAQQEFAAGEGALNRTATATNQAAARNAPLEMVPDPYGEGRMIPRAQAEAKAVTAGAAPKPMTDEQAKAAGYVDRMTEAERILADPAVVDAAMSRFNKAVTGGYTGVGAPFGSEMAGAAYQKFDQAQRNFINAILRRESGAVISEEEFANAKKQYFPQPGDTPEVLRQKMQNRATAIAGIKRAAGPQYQQAAPAQSQGETMLALPGRGMPALPPGFIMVPR